MMSNRSVCFLIPLVHLYHILTCLNINKMRLNQSLCFMCCIRPTCLIGDFICGICFLSFTCLGAWLQIAIWCCYLGLPGTHKYYLLIITTKAVHCPFYKMHPISNALLTFYINKLWLCILFKHHDKKSSRNMPAVNCFMHSSFNG